VVKGIREEPTRDWRGKWTRTWGGRKRNDIREEKVEWLRKRPRLEHARAVGIHSILCKARLKGRKVGCKRRGGEARRAPAEKKSGLVSRLRREKSYPGDGGYQGRESRGRVGEESARGKARVARWGGSEREAIKKRSVRNSRDGVELSRRHQDLNGENWRLVKKIIPGPL